jgi:transposase
MGKRYKRYDQGQSLLLPPNLNDWIPEDHLSRFISNIVDDLDLSDIMDYYEHEIRGAPPYDPRMMVKVRIYADCKGMTSSRVIERLMIEDIGFRYLGANNFPDHRTISDFRKIHHKALADLFDQVLELCAQAGLVKMDTVAIDGFKLEANASMDKNYTMETLSEKERKFKKIGRKIIEDGIKLDEEEDRIYGPDNSGWRLPKDALERVRKAKKELEQQREEELREYEDRMKEREQQEKESGKKVRGRKLKHPDQRRRKNTEKRKKCANTTDPESRVMKSKKGFVQAYNAQIAVDADTQIILATSLTQDHNDKLQLSPLLEQAMENTGKVPRHATADAGYDNQDHIDKFSDRIEMFVPTQKGRDHRKALRNTAPPRGRIPIHSELTIPFDRASH